VIERAIINSRGPVLRIKEDLSSSDAKAEMAATKTLEQMERDHITRILEDLNWRIDGPRGGARLLGINPSTLRNRMTKLGIQKPNGKSNGNSD
jgi:transcriptional regulator with GAF, ATPase, and Fis domain